MQHFSFCSTKEHRLLFESKPATDEQFEGLEKDIGVAFPSSIADEIDAWEKRIAELKKRNTAVSKQEAEKLEQEFEEVLKKYDSVKGNITEQTRFDLFRLREQARAALRKSNGRLDELYEMQEIIEQDGGKFTVEAGEKKYEVTGVFNKRHELMKLKIGKCAFNFKSAITMRRREQTAINCVLALEQLKKVLGTDSVQSIESDGYKGECIHEGDIYLITPHFAAKQTKAPKSEDIEAWKTLNIDVRKAKAAGSVMASNLLAKAKKDKQQEVRQYFLSGTFDKITLDLFVEDVSALLEQFNKHHQKLIELLNKQANFDLSKIQNIYSVQATNEVVILEKSLLNGYVIQTQHTDGTNHTVSIQSGTVTLETQEALQNGKKITTNTLYDVATGNVVQITHSPPGLQGILQERFHGPYKTVTYNDNRIVQQEAKSGRTIFEIRQTVDEQGNLIKQDRVFYAPDGTALRSFLDTVDAKTRKKLEALYEQRMALEDKAFRKGGVTKREFFEQRQKIDRQITDIILNSSYYDDRARLLAEPEDINMESEFFYSYMNDNRSDADGYTLNFTGRDLGEVEHNLAQLHVIRPLYLAHKENKDFDTEFCDCDERGLKGRMFLDARRKAGILPKALQDGWGEEAKKIVTHHAIEIDIPGHALAIQIFTLPNKQFAAITDGTFGFDQQLGPEDATGRPQGYPSVHEAVNVVMSKYMKNNPTILRGIYVQFQNDNDKMTVYSMHPHRRNTRTIPLIKALTDEEYYKQEWEIDDMQMAARWLTRTTTRNAARVKLLEKYEKMASEDNNTEYLSTFVTEVIHFGVTDPTILKKAGKHMETLLRQKPASYRYQIMKIGLDVFMGHLSKKKAMKQLDTMLSNASSESQKGEMISILGTYKMDTLAAHLIQQMNIQSGDGYQMHVIYNIKAKAALQQGKYAEAEKLALEAAKQNVDFPTLLMSMFHLGKYKEMEGLIGRYHAVYPLETTVYSINILQKVKTGNMQLAALSYALSIKIDPDHPCIAEIIESKLLSKKELKTLYNTLKATPLTLDELHPDQDPVTQKEMDSARERDLKLLEQATK